MTFLHRMSEHPRGVAEFAELTDWQIVQLHFADAARVARERKRIMDGLAPDDGEPVREKKARRDRDGKPVPVGRAEAAGRARQMYGKRATSELIETEYQMYLKRFNKQHGTDYK